MVRKGSTSGFKRSASYFKARAERSEDYDRVYRVRTRGLRSLGSDENKPKI